MEWNYGQSPKYNFRKKTRLPSGGIEALLQVEDGIITSARLYGDYFGACDIGEIEKLLCGTKHSHDGISRALSGVEISRYFLGATFSDLVSALY